MGEKRTPRGDMATGHQTKETRCFLVSGLLLVIILSLSFGCDYFGFTKIREIMDAPLNFEGKEVKLKGVVMDAVRLPFTEMVVYTLKDDTGSITIIGTGAKPNNGDRVRVKGSVSTMVKIGVETFGTHIREIKRW